MVLEDVGGDVDGERAERVAVEVDAVVEREELAAVGQRVGGVEVSPDGAEEAEPPELADGAEHPSLEGRVAGRAGSQ